jgi:DME family drug/metabolite transporter
MSYTRPRTRNAPGRIAQISMAEILWDTAPIAFEMIHSHAALSSIAISAQRLAIASLVLVVATASLGLVRSVGEPVLAHPARIAMLGAGIAGYQTLWFASITPVGSSTATVLSLGSATVLVPAWESWRARARPSTGRRSSSSRR